MNKTGRKKSSLRIGMVAATLAGSALVASSPAAADQFGVSINVGAVGFSYNSGGYCDDFGCPDSYWDDPVYYCPVYFHHRWYRGPVYYSRRSGGTYYWIRRGWRRDEWDGPRPSWACNDRYGPALDLYFYQSNGFRVRNAWWNSWGREHNDWYWRDHPDWNRNQNFGGRIAQGQEWDRARTWTGVSHPWASAHGQGFDRGGQSGGAMGVNPSHSLGGGSQGADQGTQHRGAGGGTPSGSSMTPGGGQGNPQPGNMSGAGAPQDRGAGQGTDHSNRHHGKPSDTGDQGNSGNGGGDSGNGHGHDNANSGQGQGAPDNAGNDKGAGKKHGDHGGDQNGPDDSGNGNPH